MSIDLEQRLRDDLRRRADGRVLETVPVDHIVAVSHRRARRRQFALSAATLVVVLAGLGALFAVARQPSSIADRPIVCVSPCVSVASADGQDAVVVSKGADNVRVVTLDDGVWSEVDTDLPDDIAPSVLERHDGQWWLAGSSSGPDPDVRLPVVATSTDLAHWDVQRLGFAGAAPLGFHLSAVAEALAFADSAIHASGQSTVLVPNDDVYGDTTVCDTAVEATMLHVDLCDGRTAEALISSALADALTRRSVWASGPSNRLVPQLRQSNERGWDVFASNGDELLALLHRPDETFASAAADGTTWRGLGALDCPDGSTGQVENPTPFASDAGSFVVAGSCGGVPTVWTGVSADAWTVTQPHPRPGSFASIVIDRAGLVVDVADATGGRTRYWSPDGVVWSEADGDGDALALTSNGIVVSSVSGLDIVALR